MAFSPGAGLRALGGIFIFLFSGVLSYLIFTKTGLFYFAILAVAIFVAEFLVQMLFAMVRIRFSRSYFSIFSGFGIVLFYEIIKLLGLLNYLIITFSIGIIMAAVFVVVLNKIRKGGGMFMFGFGKTAPRMPQQGNPQNPDMPPGTPI